MNSVKGLIIAAVLLVSLLLQGCDSQYKQKIQDGYDRENILYGDKAKCLSVGLVTKDMYPYTIKYIEGENKESRQNNRLNHKLSLYAKEGLFTEELVGQQGDLPLYRYTLTELGNQYVDWRLARTNFCFGKIIVDNIVNVSDVTNGIGGGTIRVVKFRYHLENIPQWIKNPEIYSLYQGYGVIEGAVKGKSVSGFHEYGKNWSGEWVTRIDESGNLYF